VLFVFDWDIGRYMIGPDGEQNVPHKEWLSIFQDVLIEFSGNLRAQKRDDEFIGAKVLVIL
jgi:adenosine deaminase CECR1